MYFKKLLEMKRIIFFLIILTFAACKKDFLNKGPLTNLSEESYWKQGSDAEYAVNGLYEAFYEFDGGGEFLPGGAPYMDLCTDLMYLKAPWEFGFNDFNTGNLTADNGWVASFWKKKYQYIRNCNFFFDNVDKVKDQLSPESYNNLSGQARVVRAFLYLRLVQGFGDVPLITKTISADEWPARTPAAEVMEFVIAELAKAAEELPEEQSDGAHGRIYKYVALAYKARAALHFAGFYNKPEYYEVAAEALATIVNSGKFELFRKVEDPTDNFTQIFWAANEGADNKEIIFSDQFIKDLRPSNISTSFAGPGWKGQQAQQNYIDMFEDKAGWQAHHISFKEMNSYRNTKVLKSPLDGKSATYDPKNEFADRDPRLNATFFNPNIYVDANGVIQKRGEDWAPANRNFAPDWENDCYFFKKLVDPTNFNPVYYYGNSDNNFPLVRYSDMLLLYAEALNEIGRTGEAATYVNLVRNRVDMPDIATGDQDEMREIIKHERKIELIAEQVLVWDYKRWREYERTMPGAAEFYGFRREAYGQSSILLQRKYITNKYYLWPIPAVELRNNQNMVQNIGW